MGSSPLSHLQGVAAFVHAVESGSFTAAAARAGLSKSAIGKSVARLEQRLGVRLLDRTTRSLSMTAEGQAYYASCVAVLAELGRAEAQLAARQQEVSGRLRVNLPLSLGRMWVAPLLHPLARMHPKLDLEISFSDRVVDLVEDGLDLVVRIGDPGNQASLVGRRLGTQCWVTCAAPFYLDTRGRPRSPEELASHDCLVFARDGFTRPWRHAVPGATPTEMRMRARHWINHGEALRDAALAGLGVAHLPTWLIADDIRSKRLEAVLAGVPVEGEVIHVLWHRSKDMLPKVRAAIGALVKGFIPAPPWEDAVKHHSL
ncbi:LysR family transcriptional regulator [Sphingomonas sp. TREG-RG-20F-R18-01]|uniref:LysR family transcriptional regulator n=1 Tax=Sphingomonas sp. TREG-RG-20F-R18-01 TaxID=2914982 RepID=UPI001F57F63C|nr:LysR family transcriptional regulator [Sphingomonas sp. TREG-RG-20F-R18-01]